MADEINQRLDRIETALAELRGSLAQLRLEFATKDDLAALRADFAGVAKNVEIRALQRLIQLADRVAVLEKPQG